ncbi:MAG: hypothetical protein ASARMPREDX12_002354 [Alectoria sarmentosa]|nr:MAG: hypothetical protein ASARMPREDX12_002354 [Alectoria sarmentosa]
MISITELITAALIYLLPIAASQQSLSTQYSDTNLTDYTTNALFAHQQFLKARFSELHLKNHALVLELAGHISRDTKVIPEALLEQLKIVMEQSRDLLWDTGCMEKEELSEACVRLLVEINKVGVWVSNAEMRLRKPEIEKASVKAELDAEMGVNEDREIVAGEMEVEADGAEL